METENYWKTMLVTLLIAVGMTACNDDDNISSPKFVENAGLVENGQTLLPGETVHLTGNGYLDSDDVMLNFYWETGESAIPEGYIKGYYAEILESSSDGIAIRLPYRKPKARVEVWLTRGGEMMLIGELHVEDGSTPKAARLYGINNNLHNKGYFIDATQVTCVFNEKEGYDRSPVQWTLEEHPDFHSAVACWKSYGLCGLSKVNGYRCPFFFDFCTAEWRQLANIPTIALCSYPSAVVALQQTDKESYALHVISSDLERSDYVTADTRTAPMPPMTFPLPENLKAEQFGEYPGAFTGTELFLFSANKGDGKWTPVIFGIHSGFHVLDDIEADGLIPFSFVDKDKKWRFGYIVARDNAVNGTELYLSGDNADTLFDAPYAVYPNRAVSVSANYDNPGTLTVHFAANRAGNVTSDFLYETREWKPVNYALGLTADEMIWTN